MNVVFDPVWPWSHLGEVLLEVPDAVRIVALMAALASGVVAARWIAGVSLRQRGNVVILLCIVAALVLFARHAYGAVSSDGVRGVSTSRWFLSAMAFVTWLVTLLLSLPILAGLSAGSYLNARGSARLRAGNASDARQRLLVLSLRLLAFALAFIALVRPSLGWSEGSEVRSTILLSIDASQSMSVMDEVPNASRWVHLLAQLDAARPAITKLRDTGTDVQMVRFADKVTDWDASLPPDGSTTDIGGMLRDLFERRDPRALPRAVLVVSDGAEHGLGAMTEAVRWGNAPCPVTTFACGSATTTLKQNDVAITSITTSPQPTVPMKGKLTVRLTVDARGYENQPLKVRLRIEDKNKGTDRELLARDEHLPLTTGNELRLEAFAPEQPGEYLLRAVVEPAEPDAAPANNTIETFVTVSREGMNVLLVDRSRFEPVFIYDALTAAGVNVVPVWVRSGSKVRSGNVGEQGGSPPRFQPSQTLPALDGTGVLKLDDQPYDAIILGDVAPEQLRALDPQSLEKIEKQLARGTGLLLLGGYNSFGPAWRGTPLEAAFPIDLSEQKQDDTATRMVPTDDGRRVARYLFRIEDGDDKEYEGPGGGGKSLAAWEKLEKLQGRSVIRLPDKPRGTETVLAKTTSGEPLLISGIYGSDRKAVARVVAFGGDTTYRWVRDEDSRRRFERFWRQMLLWLGRQEDAEGGVWVRPDATTRRIAVGSDLSFRVGLRGKGGMDIQGGTFTADVTAPDGTSSRVPLNRGANETRGVFVATRQAGIYRIDVKGSGKEQSGAEISGTASARVIAFDEDLERSRVAADPDFLQKLSVAGGGEAHRVEALKDVLDRLAASPGAADLSRQRHAPDWRTTGRSSFLMGFVLTFCTVVCIEWGLRRLWGMA